VSANEDESRAVIARLARPHASGDYVVDEAALRAEGSAFPTLKAWIFAHGGIPETPRPAAGRGLHGSGRLPGVGGQSAGRAPRYLLPASALASPPALGLRAQ
jgi:hypothetical protein